MTRCLETQEPFNGGSLGGRRCSDEQRFFYARSAHRKNKRSFNLIHPFVFSKTSVRFSQYVRLFSIKRPFVYIRARVHFSAEVSRVFRSAIHRNFHRPERVAVKTGRKTVSNGN